MEIIYGVVFTLYVYLRFVLGNKFDFTTLLYGQIGSHKDEATLHTLQLRRRALLLRRRIVQLGQLILIDAVDFGWLVGMIKPNSELFRSLFFVDCSMFLLLN